MTAKIEIFDLQQLDKTGYGPVGVYVNLGYEPYPENFNPLPDSEFDSYTPDEGFIKNTGLRTPLFTGGFLSSPLLDNGDYQYLTDSKGYTWLYNTFNYMAIDPFQRKLYPKGTTRYSAVFTPPPEGSLQIIVNDKNQPQTFAAKDSDDVAIEHFFATDKNGNKFILGSIDAIYADDPKAAFLASVLPKGWTKTIETLEADLTIDPAYGDGNRRIYNQFRDSMTNNYFQVEFAPNGINFARGIPGLALAGGNESDLITGSRLGETIYGAQGNDILIGRGGDDTIWGDDGDDLLRPGRGKNNLWGGAGQDTFLARIGNNIIHDFSLEDGDVISLGRGFYSLNDTSDGARIRTLFGSTLISGVLAADLVPGENLLT